MAHWRHWRKFSHWIWLLNKIQGNISIKVCQNINFCYMMCSANNVDLCFYLQQAKTIVLNNWCLVISFSSSSNNEFNYEPRQTISLGGIDCPSSQLSSLGAFYGEGDIMASFSAIFSGDKKGKHHPEQNRNKIYLRELYRSSHIFLTT